MEPKSLSVKNTKDAESSRFDPATGALAFQS